MNTTTKFDRQEVIQKATDLFWEKGFHATSMRNLQEVIDMRPGSIYATFGSKEGLFMEALQHYAEESLASLSAYVNESDSPLNALKTFIKESVQGSVDQAPSDMCMLVKTIAELTEENAGLLTESKRLLKSIEDAFANLLDQAQKAGEIDKTKDTRRLARFLQMQMMGLKSYARTNGEDANIAELIDDAFNILLARC